ncbi:MAG: hypothetical protein JSV88_24745 [Candidatus Aminicenantes bacterium]|nr:MAG: hypothetical protein JSV88_24745 [Candidatus Aminicenantes bacterium]
MLSHSSAQLLDAFYGVNRNCFDFIVLREILMGNIDYYLQKVKAENGCFLQKVNPENRNFEQKVRPEKRGFRQKGKPEKK